MNTIQPYVGNPDPIICESQGDGLLIRQIAYVPGIEPQLYLVEQCVNMILGCPLPNALAAGIERSQLWRDYWSKK